MLTRRHFSLAALGSLTSASLLARPDSVVNGVQIGVQSYSFRDRSLDDALKAMVTIGLSECELYQGHVEPNLRGHDLDQWRENAPLAPFESIRKKFDEAGVKLYAFNYSFRENYSDRAIEHGFEMAKALGADKITASSNLATVDRIDKYAQQYKTYVGMHNHSNLKPGEFASPESFAQAMDGRSKYICINLDIGHFTAANFDAEDYLMEHRERILTIHIKDRKRDQGDNVPFGQGDTPIKQVLTILKLNQWKIPANIEYEYKGGDTVEEVAKCYKFCKEAIS